MPYTIENVNIEDVESFPGMAPGAEDIFLEFDWQWRGDQNICLLLNPIPEFMQSVAGLSSVVNRIFTWTVSWTSACILSQKAMALTSAEAVRLDLLFHRLCLAEPIVT